MRRRGRDAAHRARSMVQCSGMDELVVSRMDIGVSHSGKGRQKGNRELASELHSQMKARDEFDNRVSVLE